MSPEIFAQIFKNFEFAHKLAQSDNDKIFLIFFQKAILTYLDITLKGFLLAAKTD